MNGDIWRREWTGEFQLFQAAGEATYLGNKRPNHVVLGPLERPERAPKVETDLVFLALHTDPKEKPARLLLEIVPDIMSQEVAVLLWIQSDICPADLVVLADKVTVPDGRHDPNTLGHRDVKCLVPCTQKKGSTEA